MVYAFSSRNLEIITARKKNLYEISYDDHFSDHPEFVDLPSCGVATKFANMEYQMLTYFDKFTFQIYYFLKLSFPICQVHFAKMLDSQVHIAKSSTPHRQIVNSTLQVIHCQLAKLTSFSGLPPSFTLTPKYFNILPNA
jgi:hypothetical protein